MSLWSIFWWLFIGWLVTQGFHSIRQAWQQNPANPTRIFLADFAGLLVFISVLWNLVPYGFIHIMDNTKEVVVRMATIPVGIGKVERGEFVLVRSYYSDTSLAQKLIALPQDELSVQDGIIHINGVPLGATADAFLPIDADCETEIIPPEHFAIMDWLGTEPISCDEIQIRPIEDLQARCLAVIWPFSQSCRAPTNEIPVPPK